jgi:nitrate reductase gamma subunit
MVCREGVFLTVIIGLWLIYKIDRLHRNAIPERMMEEIEKLSFGLKLKVFFQTLVLDVFLLTPLFTTHKLRWIKHMLVFWGSVAIFVAALIMYAFGPEVNITPPTDLLWFLNTLGVIMVLLGGLLALIRFVQRKREEATSPYADAPFLALLCAAVGTGFLMKYYGTVEPALSLDFLIYVLHLVAVAASLIAMPFTRFMHIAVAPYAKFFERFRVELEKRNIVIDFKGEELTDYALESFYLGSAKITSTLPEESEK